MQKYSLWTVINFYILRDQPVDSPSSLRSYCVQPHTDILKKHLQDHCLQVRRK